MRRFFEAVLIVDLYTDVYRQQSRTGKSRKSGVFRDTMEGCVALILSGIKT